MLVHVSEATEDLTLVEFELVAVAVVVVEVGLRVLHSSVPDNSFVPGNIRASLDAVDMREC